MSVGNHGKRGTTLRGIAPLIFCLAFIWPFGGGGRTFHLMSGTSAPGARGTVQVKNGDNSNTILDVKVHALANPSTLTPAENVYVVWIEPPGQSPQNLGQITVNQKEDGELHTVTASQRFHIFITAEQNANAQMPQGPRILSADISGS